MAEDIGVEVLVDRVTLRLDAASFLFDVRIRAGVVTIVAGASGSGKSTLLNLIAGFERPESGHILIAGREMSSLHPSKRPISLVFQDNNLFAHLDIFTNVGLGISPSLRLDAQQKRSVSEALERVGLGGFERRKPGGLSGGERQRAAFARALVRNKPLLLLDEPFAALDPGLRADMAALLKDLHRQTGNTVIMVSHDRREVAELADDVVFLDGGRVVFWGSSEDFINHRELAAIERFLEA